jgi:hypothetical protein
VPVNFTVTCGNPATCGTQTFSGTYFQRPTALHAPTILRNDGRYDTYKGLELTARKRFSNRWMMTGSVVRNDQAHFEPEADRDYLDPTNHDFINGYESGTRNGKWVGKLSGMYQLPWGVAAAAKFEGHTSFPFNATILSPNRTGNQSGVQVNLYPVNSVRLPTLYQLDLHVDKGFSLSGSRRFTLNFDLFNVSNNATILARTAQQNSSSASNVTTILGPRIARFGVKVNF